MLYTRHGWCDGSLAGLSEYVVDLPLPGSSQADGVLELRKSRIRENEHVHVIQRKAYIFRK